MTRQINSAGVELVKRFEGFYADAYLCPAGVWTIGYGHTGGVQPGQQVTQSEAERLLRDDLAAAGAAVERYITVELTDNQFSALVSFTFNLGTGNLVRSTLRRRLNTGDYDAVPAELARWVQAGGKTLEGLVRRRAAEGELFLRPDGSGSANPMPRMPQRVESVDALRHDGVAKPYLTDDLALNKGSVDDRGDARYIRLSQNVPDGYVTDLQNDLRSLGFTEVGTPDGAFGNDTKRAVRAFQTVAGLDTASGIVDRATKDALIQWLQEGFTKHHPPELAAADCHAAGDNLTLIVPRVPHYSQGDPRWAQRVLGRDTSMQRAGCAVSCIAMILSFYGRRVTPGTLDAYLDANDGYSGNHVKWFVAGQCAADSASNRLLYDRTTGDRRELTDRLAARIDRNLPTIVRVDYGTDANLLYNHFVVCVGKTAAGDLIMNDPATHLGDGYRHTTDENIIQKTSRKNGYHIVQLDYYDPV